MLLATYTDYDLLVTVVMIIYWFMAERYGELMLISVGGDFFVNETVAATFPGKLIAIVLMGVSRQFSLA